MEINVCEYFANVRELSRMHLGPRPKSADKGWNKATENNALL